ncbi:hypothetical protein DPMN_042207 [Dreissena polymorpha]|uniref:Uncharacterized protein n=1 Tax=Dreissena polymorpha TaxID=45954 RepID=A0A9D4D055_DREPO|nr:hypothetical protein DPMN_042207 [Dreissena polymorpha]
MTDKIPAMSDIDTDISGFMPTTSSKQQVTPAHNAIVITSLHQDGSLPPSTPDPPSGWKSVLNTGDEPTPVQSCEKCLRSDEIRVNEARLSKWETELKSKQKKLDAIQKDNCKLEALVKKLENKNNEMNPTIKTLNTRIFMLEKEIHPCTPQTSENHPVTSETATPSLTCTINLDQLGGVSSKFVTSCQTLHDKITDIVFSKIQKKVDFVASVFKNNSQTISRDDSCTSRTIFAYTQVPGTATSDAGLLTGDSLFHVTPPISTNLIPQQTPKWPPPLHMPPPGYPVSGSIPVYPHTKVQTQLATNVLVLYGLITVTMRPLEAFIR